MEITTEFPVTPWWTIKANYTFQEVEYKRVNQDVPGTPKHKFNIGSCFTFENGFSMNMNAHYVDDTKWSGLTGNVKTDDYIRLDIRIAQKLLGGRLELALVGQNLLDNTHPETSDVTGTYETERLIYGQMTVQFK
jgi:outer membrane receptor protein involved in Fe transport